MRCVTNRSRRFRKSILPEHSQDRDALECLPLVRVGGATGGVVLASVVACTPPPLHEPPFIETTGSPIASACIAPSAWNCVYPNVTRKNALDALEVADLARALQKPGKPPRRWDPELAKSEERESARGE